MTKVTFLGLLAVTALGLTACGGGGGSHQTPLNTPAKLEDKFGTPFGQDFRADPNASPAAVKSGDVIPVDPTVTPTTLH